MMEEDKSSETCSFPLIFTAVRVQLTTDHSSSCSLVVAILVCCRFFAISNVNLVNFLLKVMITSDLSYFADLFAFLKKCYLVLKYFSEG